jgi:maleate isomerase
MAFLSPQELGLIEKVETRLDKPMLTNNAMVLWSAMRSQGFDDRIEGLGTLWRDH